MGLDFLEAERAGKGGCPDGWVIIVYRYIDHRSTPIFLNGGGFVAVALQLPASFKISRRILFTNCLTIPSLCEFVCRYVLTQRQTLHVTCPRTLISLLESSPNLDHLLYSPTTQNHILIWIYPYNSGISFFFIFFYVQGKIFIMRTGSIEARPISKFL